MNKEHTIKTYKELSKIPYGHADTSITPGCIVVEGGAFRGLYNQGVLDALMENNLNFACTIGTSAGALAGFNYVAGQIGRSARANLTYRHYTDYVGRGALTHAHSPIRLDFLFNDYNAIEPFDEKSFQGQEVEFDATLSRLMTSGIIHNNDKRGAWFNTHVIIITEKEPRLKNCPSFYFFSRKGSLCIVDCSVE